MIKHRKHTGEKPFVCVVPLCTKAFSRFDNMMQHTQTHRNNNYNIITGGSNQSKSSCNHKENTTRSSTRVAQRQQQHQQQQQSSPSPLFSPKRNHSRQHSSTSSSEEEDEEEEMEHPITPTRRRLSVADLCNPSDTITNATTNMNNIHLTKDEYEALEGFGRFRHSPSVFFDSLKDLASTVHIEPY